MPNFPFDIARRICSQLGLAILVLGFASSAANAGISSGLRDLLQGAMGADLRVDSLALDKGQATIGETLRATVGISNGGKAAASSTVLTLWGRFGASTSTSNAFRLGTVRLGTLQPQTRITSVSTFPVPNFGRFGAYQIFATVESAAPEQNRQNNTQAKTLMVVGPAFSDTDSQPASDSGGSSVPPPAPTPIAGGGSSSPPASNPGSGSTSPPPNSGSSPPPPALVSPPLSVSCDYYASPNGRGNGTTRQTPFLIQNFWAVATPGKTLCLLDGLYTGAASMISPQAQGQADGSPSGTQAAKLTIRALNDGQVLIDGQFARQPVSFRGNTDIEVHGINARNAGPRRDIYSVENGAKRISFRRVGGWDQALSPAGAGGAKNIFATYDPGTEGILFEDCFGFGLVQRVARQAFDAVRTTYRRCWFRQEGDPDTAIDPTSIFNLWRRSGTHTVENVLFTLDGSRAGADQFSRLIIRTGQLGCSGGSCAPGVVKLLGSILYLKAGAGSQTGVPGLGLSVNNDSSSTDNGSLIIEHFVAYALDHSGIKLVDLRAAGSDFSGRASHITSIRHRSAPAATYTGFSGNNRVEATSLSGIDIYTAASGANICRRYQDGVPTTLPLWPWPMDQRIQDAITIARAGQSDPKSPFLTGNSVTAEIEDLFGAIPSQCRAS